MDISLNFVNQSESTSPLNVVIFQKNLFYPNPGTAVAWRVLSQFAQGNKVPMTFGVDKTIAAGSFGNLTPQQPAAIGDNFTYVANVSGTQLVRGTPTANSPVISVTNDLPVGAIDVNAYRGGDLLSVKTAVQPGQQAQFVFDLMLYLAIAPGIRQGDLMTLSSLSTQFDMINLMGIGSMDIVLTGGGQTPFMLIAQNQRPG